jgi:hypothetical protein
MTCFCDTSILFLKFYENYITYCQFISALFSDNPRSLQGIHLSQKFKIFIPEEELSPSAENM